MKNVGRNAYLVASLLLSTCARSQDTLLVYPSMANVEVSVSASVAKSDSLYQYSYSVANDTGAYQRVWIFMVQVEAAIQAGQAPSNWDVSSARRPGVTTTVWGAHDSTAFIAPGGASAGFVCSTTGLPKILTYYAVGRVEPPQGEFEIAPGSNDMFINSKQGRSVGPAAPPTPFVALVFLDTLISMVNEAKSLNWILESDLSDLIDTRLTKARDHLESEDESGALEDLQAALNAVDADCLGVGPGPGVSYLTTEGCALLRYNIEYLMEQLE